MNLCNLYDLLASRTRADGVIDLPTWADIAKAAEVDPLDDAAALRALIQKNAVKRRTVRNTFGDYAYELTRPEADRAAAFRAVLSTPYAVWRG